MNDSAQLRLRQEDTRGAVGRAGSEPDARASFFVARIVNEDGAAWPPSGAAYRARAVEMTGPQEEGSPVTATAKGAAFKVVKLRGAAVPNPKPPAPAPEAVVLVICTVFDGVPYFEY